MTMSNELGAPKILMCPGDYRRMMLVGPDDFRDFGRLPKRGDDAVSYFVGLDARRSLPNAMLAGDWSIGSSAPHRGGVLLLQTNDSIWWTTNLHGGAGNVLLADGSVWQTTSARLQQYLAASPLPTNRLLMPMP